MDAQPGLLLSALRQRAPEAADDLERFRARLEQALADGELTARHGPVHWRAVEIHAARLVPERIFQQLPVGEFSLMSAACVLHDLSIDGRDAGGLLVEDPRRWGIHGPYATALRVVCDAMITGGARLRRGQRWAYLYREAADLRRVGAILHVADRIDVDHTDCPMPDVITDLPPEKQSQWANERGLTVGLIDPREGTLRLDLVSTNRTWRRQIEEYFMPFAQAAMAASRNVLLAAGMPFREIELHDLHAKPSADVARARELLQARSGARRRPVQPFKLLDSFEEDESHLLAARDEDVVKVAGRALTSQVTVLFGESGIGKTSLVAAGVLPWLREHGYDGVYARCLHDPTQSLVDAVGARLGHEHGILSALPEAATALAASAETPVLLVLDQCQELFTRLGSRTRLEFARDLADLFGMPGDPAHVLLVVQREYFVHLAELLPALPTLYQETVELKRFTREQAQLVIRRALGRFRTRFDGLVANHLVDDLCTADGISPVELQICCETLHANLDEGETTVGYDLYRRLGPAQRILDGLLESRLKAFRWRRHSLAKTVLVSCVTANRTKALVTAEDCAVDNGIDQETAQELLDELVQVHLLRRVAVREGFVYELRHEYLAKSLEPWISDVEREAKDVDDLLHRELNNYQRFQLLLDREKLRLIHQYRRRLTLTPEELDLIIRSAAQERFEVDYWFTRVGELTVSQQMVLCVDLLYSPEPDLRDALRSMISRLDHKAILPTLLDSLREADAGVRETAIEVLREINGNLVHALEQPGDAARQQQAAYALGQIGAEHAVPSLVESARSGTEEVREQAVEALAGIDRTRSAEMLIRSLRTGNQRSRWNAAMALGRLGRDAAVREQLRHEAERPHEAAVTLFAYARACLEGRHFAESERVLRELEHRAVPDDQRYRVEQAWNDLRALRGQEKQGLLAWPMYRGSPSGAAASAASLRLPLELKWEFATRDRVFSSPAVTNGVVYIGSTDHRLYAIDTDSGAQHWQYDVGAELHSTPCVIDDRVYIGAMDGTVHAIDCESGELQWQRDFGGAIESSIRGTAERLLVGTMDGVVASFSPQDGKVQWRTQIDGEVTASPALANGLVAIGSETAGLMLLSAVDGEAIWTWQVDGGLRGSPALVDSHVIFGSGAGRVEVLDTGGNAVWSAVLDSPVGSSPAVSDGRVYVGGVDGDIEAFSLGTGQRAWTFKTEGEVSASPAVAAGSVFVGSQSGDLFALRARDGQPEWRYRTGYSIHSTPAVADGRLFVALRYYNMCAFGEPVEVEEVH